MLIFISTPVAQAVNFKQSNLAIALFLLISDVLFSELSPADTAQPISPAAWKHNAVTTVVDLLITCVSHHTTHNSEMKGSD